MSTIPPTHSSIVVRRATEADADAMAHVEASARELLESQGVDFSALCVPEGFEERPHWSLAFVAEVGGEVVGMARLTELTSEVICLDQVSTAPQCAARGVGRRLLSEVAAVCRERGYAAITGTTFRDVAFNAPFYTRLGCVEEPDPHPAMVHRRRVEQEAGMDQLGPRLVMRLPLTPPVGWTPTSMNRRERGLRSAPTRPSRGPTGRPGGSPATLRGRTPGSGCRRRG